MLLPPINDLEVREVIRALHEAAPELLVKVIRAAWERAGALRCAMSKLARADLDQVQLDRGSFIGQQGF